MNTLKFVICEFHSMKIKLRVLDGCVQPIKIEINPDVSFLNSSCSDFSDIIETAKRKEKQNKQEQAADDSGLST